MPQFNIADAKSHFSELVQKALTGEDVVIARDNKPILRLVPVKKSTGKGRKSVRQRGKFFLSLLTLMNHWLTLPSTVDAPAPWLTANDFQLLSIIW